ncbi:MAG TPA: M48 family metalloprotease [Actinomycetota bacterium]|nr:M48 family metalloprotease [Actinomycetota bacterium]
MRTAWPAIRNVLKAWALLLGLVAVLGALGWWIEGLRVALVFGFGGLLVGLGSYWYSDRIVLGMVGARELSSGEALPLQTTVEKLALRARVVKPRLYVIPDSYPRAFSVGRSSGSSAIAVSTGLLGAPSPAEFEGIIAHEVAHIRNRDTLVQTTVVVLAGSLVEFSRIGGWLERALLYVLGPVAASFTHLLLSPRREFEADRLAAELCESPHGLADALVGLEQASELVHFEASPATEPLYTVNPFADEGLARLFVTHPPVGERVRRLRELDPGWREKLRAA